MLSLFILSCNSDESTEKRTYYNFEDDDYDKIISYDINQILKFRNEDNEILSFTVIDSSVDFKNTNYIHYVGL